MYLPMKRFVKVKNDRISKCILDFGDSNKNKLTTATGEWHPLVSPTSITEYMHNCI